MSEIKKFFCEICFEPIGFVDVDRLSVPMKPDVFTSLLPTNGVPDPFHPDLEWIDFKCPICRNRPFLHHDKIVVGKNQESKRVYEINQNFKCRCGKEYSHQSSLARHKKDCNGKK